MAKIYCAGPLFNDSEKKEMADIASVLENAGYDVFLPHRDGLEYANLQDHFLGLGIDGSQIQRVLNKAIFYLDVYHVIKSDGLVLNINGRVPDEGAMVEAGIAWGRGKPICIYKKDARTLLSGSDNPMITGLSNFSTFDDLLSISRFFDAALSRSPASDDGTAFVVDRVYRIGEDIASAIVKGLEPAALCKKLLHVLGGDDGEAI